jgi:hypothetical protein
MFEKSGKFHADWRGSAEAQSVKSAHSDSAGQKAKTTRQRWRRVLIKRSSG